MTKKILFGVALLAGLSACKGDYDDWASPQSNAQQAIADKFVMTAQPTVQVINFATETADSIQLFTSNVPGDQSSVENFTVNLTSGDAVPQVLTADAAGKVAAADLKAAVISMYGKAPTERSIDMGIEADIKLSINGNAVGISRNIDNLGTLKVTLDAPKLEESYYYIGAVTTNNTYQFTNASGKSFYDDPVLSVVVPAYDGDWHWCRIASGASFNEDGSINWDKENANPESSICPVIKDDDATEGACMNGTQAWHIIQSADFASYRITVNVIDMTFTIQGISAVPEYYCVGTVTSWNANEKVSAMFPTSNTAVTLTTYFTGAWDMRMWPAENFGDWGNGKAIGIAENGGNAPSGALCWNTDNDGNLASPEAGYYTLDCDYGTMTYQWTKCADQNPATYEKIGLVGGNDDWNNDIFLTKVTNTSGNDTHLWYALNVKIDFCSWGVQFRANAAWDKQWGKGDGVFPYAQSNTKDNIDPIEPGTYNVYFNDITGHYYFVAQ